MPVLAGQVASDAEAPAAAPTEAEAKAAAELAAAEAVAEMDAAKQEVFEKTGMAAPMELDLVHGEDDIEEARKLGVIAEVTLEEVEAAMAAAAATPDPEDDIEAMRLKHSGSYRFYSPED